MEQYLLTCLKLIYLIGSFLTFSIQAVWFKAIFTVVIFVFLHNVFWEISYFLCSGSLVQGNLYGGYICFSSQRILGNFLLSLLRQSGTRQSLRRLYFFSSKRILGAFSFYLLRQFGTKQNFRRLYLFFFFHSIFWELSHFVYSGLFGK